MWKMSFGRGLGLPALFKARVPKRPPRNVAPEPLLGKFHLGVKNSAGGGVTTAGVGGLFLQETQRRR